MQTFLLWAPFVSALAIGIASLTALRKDLKQLMGIPTWDFSRSWASNISVVGGLVTLSALGFLPADFPTQISRPAYAVLLFVFPLLAGLAPLVYNFSRRVSRDTTTTPPTVVSQGKAYLFIIASIFTMWAAIGQLAVQASIIEELRLGNLLPGPFARLIEIVFGLVALGLLKYGFSTVVETVKIQRDTTTTVARMNDALLGETESKRWALL